MENALNKMKHKMGKPEAKKRTGQLFREKIIN